MTQETRSREGEEQYPTQYCKPTTHTKTTQQENGRTTSYELHPPASQTYVKHTPIQVTGGPNYQTLSIETISTAGAKPSPALQYQPTIHTKNILQGYGHTPTNRDTSTRERRARHKLYSSASPTHEHHTPTQDTGGPNGQRTNNENSSTKGAKPNPSPHDKFT